MVKWKQQVRRGVGLGLAGLTLWLLTATAGTDRLAAAALAVELGEGAVTALPFWDRVALGQSALVLSNAQTPPELLPEPTLEPLPEAQPAPDQDELTEEPPEAAATPGNIVERTLTPTGEGGYVTGGGLYLYNRTDLTVDLEALAGAASPITLSPAAQGPQILIIHTHATEAYADEGLYQPSDNSRTLDPQYNVIRVGEEMEKVFGEMGFSVLHDKETYDYPRYAGSYSRSGPSVADYLAQYPTLRLVLDVHRDALVGSDGTVYKPVTAIDGAKTAQVMLVVGGGHPNWGQNLTLACKLQKALDTLYPTLARPMALRKSAYNQELTPGSLLVEVGSHGNTLDEALGAARCFARAAGAVLGGL